MDFMELMSGDLKGGMMGGHKRKIFILELPMNFSLRFCNPKLLTGCGVLIFFVVFVGGILVSSKQLNPHGVATLLACLVSISTTSGFCFLGYMGREASGLCVSVPMNAPSIGNPL